MNRNRRARRTASLALRNLPVENETSRTEALLKQLVSLQKPQLQYGMPAVPDVDEMDLRRDKVHTFSVNWPTQTITTSTSLTTTLAYSFALSSLANATEFTALYDQYRLVEVTAQFYPSQGYSDAYPIYTVIDYDDATPLSTDAQAQQYGTCQVTSTNTEYWKRTFHPRAAIAAYSGAFTSFGSADRSQWFDVASPGVQYYGLKVLIPPTLASQRGIVLAVKTVWQFRNNR